MTFAVHYRQYVVPKLKIACEHMAPCILDGTQTFTEAYGVVIRFAQNLGANHLPEDVLMDLEDWISDTLLLEVQAAESLEDARP